MIKTNHFFIGVSCTSGNSGPLVILICPAFAQKMSYFRLILHDLVQARFPILSKNFMTSEPEAPHTSQVSCRSICCDALTTVRVSDCEESAKSPYGLDWAFHVESFATSSVGVRPDDEHHLLHVTKIGRKVT